MNACPSKRVNCIKIGSVHSAKSTNLVNLKAMGSTSSVEIEAEADTGANISAFKGDKLEYLKWINF